MNRKKVVVLGAGVAGLAMGYVLARSGKYEVRVLEESDTCGGLCGSFQYNNFTLDYGAHKLYSVIPGVLDELRELMGNRLVELPKKNRIFLKGRLLDYPLSLGNLMRVLGFRLFLKLGFGYAISLFKGVLCRKTPRSYEEYMIQFFGKPTYELIFEPLADKVWGNPADLHPEMARTRVPSSGGLEVLLKLLKLKKETAETNAATFYYPRSGFGDFPQKLKEEIQQKGSEVFVKTKVTAIERQNGRVTAVQALVDGQQKRFACDFLISTIPLGILSRYLFCGNTAPVVHKADELQFRHLVLVYIFIRQPLVLQDQWIFFPEKEYIFSRIFEQKQMNPELGPEDQTTICCDFTCAEDDKKWRTDDAGLIEQCIEGLHRAGFIKKEDVVEGLVKRQKNFYPRYDCRFTEKIEESMRQLKQVNNLILTGRLGMYNYNNSDHCYDMARFIGQKLDEQISVPEIWSALENRVKGYKIVD